jgi:hypothetical protein
VPRKKTTIQEEPTLTTDELRQIGNEINEFDRPTTAPVESKTPTIEILPVHETRVFAFWENNESENTSKDPPDGSAANTSKPKEQHIQFEIKNQSRFQSTPQHQFSCPMNTTGQQTYFDLWKSGQLIQAVFGDNFSYSQTNTPRIGEEQITTSEAHFGQENSAHQVVALPIREAEPLTYLDEWLYYKSLLSANDDDIESILEFHPHHILNLSHHDNQEGDDCRSREELWRDIENKSISSFETTSPIPLYWELEGVIACIQISGRLKNPKYELSYFGNSAPKTGDRSFLYYYPITQNDFISIKEHLSRCLTAKEDIRWHWIFNFVENLDTTLHFHSLEDSEQLHDALLSIGYPLEFLKPLSLSIQPPLFLIDGFKINS